MRTRVSVNHLPEGTVTGPIVGGNLTSFGSLETPYDIDTTGKILFLEETHDTVYRYLNQLNVAGKFRDCIGIVMGECTGCTEEYGKNYEDLLADVLAPLGKPLMTIYSIGPWQIQSGYSDWGYFNIEYV